MNNFEKKNDSETPGETSSAWDTVSEVEFAGSNTSTELEHNSAELDLGPQLTEEQLDKIKQSIGSFKSAKDYDFKELEESPYQKTADMIISEFAGLDWDSQTKDEDGNLLIKSGIGKYSQEDLLAVGRAAFVEYKVKHPESQSRGFFRKSMSVRRFMGNVDSSLNTEGTIDALVKKYNVEQFMDKADSRSEAQMEADRLVSEGLEKEQRRLEDELSAFAEKVEESKGDPDNAFARRFLKKLENPEKDIDTMSRIAKDSELDYASILSEQPYGKVREILIRSLLRCEVVKACSPDAVDGIKDGVGKYSREDLVSIAQASMLMARPRDGQLRSIVRTQPEAITDVIKAAIFEAKQANNESSLDDLVKKYKISELTEKAETPSEAQQEAIRQQEAFERMKREQDEAIKKAYAEHLEHMRELDFGMLSSQVMVLEAYLSMSKGSDYRDAYTNSQARVAAAEVMRTAKKLGIEGDIDTVVRISKEYDKKKAAEKAKAEQEAKASSEAISQAEASASRVPENNTVAPQQAPGQPAAQAKPKKPGFLKRLFGGR